MTKKRRGQQRPDTYSAPLRRSSRLQSNIRSSPQTLPQHHHISDSPQIASHHSPTPSSSPSSPYIPITRHHTDFTEPSCPEIPLGRWKPFPVSQPTHQRLTRWL
ncbi:unnamed protein product [Nezara viridula]|uniref:Uncharacterized protein n=1 Tax=Nezara viridula TaxID=85310 RepID=A0A9P0MSC9_NEZVI|nr:unnamed protein product [Nezara viridula]